MKRFLTLFVVLCLALTAIAIVSCGGNNDTDTNTDTQADTNTGTDTSLDTNTDVKNEETYVITVKDQEGAAISEAIISIVDADDNELKEVTTDANGQATVTVDGVYYADIKELPQGYLDLAGKVKLDKADIVMEVENNIPNGTATRPYPIEDLNEINLGAGEVVYYISYGGGRNLLIENAQGLKLTYGSDEPKEADGEGKISFKMPVSDDLYNRAVLIKLENTTAEEKSYTLTIYSDKGALDNPYDVVLDENAKITVEKEQTAYYKYIAEKDGMIVVYSESQGNNISLYNTNTYVQTEPTNGSLCEYLYASKGDEIQIQVSSIADKNYNSVEFKVSHYAGTENEPIPLYKESTNISLKKAQSLVFSLTLSEESELLIEGMSVKLVMNGEETEPSEDGIIEGITINGEVTLTVVNTNENDREDLVISFYPTVASES